jgi:WD40 repeat protein
VHKGSLAGAAMSRDGAHAAVIDTGNEIRLFDPQTAGQVAMASLGPTPPSDLAFTSDGSAVAVADVSGGVTLVRWADGSIVWEKAGFGTVTGIATSPDGKAVAVLSATAVSMLSPSDGTMRARFASGGTAVAFAPDTSYLAIAGPGTISVVSPLDGSALGPPIALTDAVSDLAVSPDATLIAAASSNAHVPVFRRSSGALAYDLKYTSATNLQSQIPDAAFRSVAFSADGSQVAAAEQALHVWRLSDGSAIVQPNAIETGFIWEQSVAHSSPYVAFQRVAGPAQVWDYTRGLKKAVLPRVVDGNQGTVAFDADDTLLVGVEEFNSNQTTTELGQFWSVGAASPTRTITFPTTEQPDRSGDLVFSPDGQTMAGPGSSSQLGLLRFWSPADGTLTSSISAFATQGGLIAWSPDGARVAMAGADTIDTSQSIPRPTDESVRIWTVSNHALVATLTGFTDVVTGLAFFPDGQHLLTSDNSGLVYVWAADGTSKRVLSDAGAQNNYVALSPKGDLVALRGIIWGTKTSDAVVPVVSASDGSEVGRFYLYGDANLEAMTWTPDGKYLLAGSSSALHVFCVDQMAPPAAGDAGSSSDAQAAVDAGSPPH